MAKKLRIVATLPPLHPGEVLREEFLDDDILAVHAVRDRAGAAAADDEIFLDAG